jgi:GH43 family beta-xylosidase
MKVLCVNNTNLSLSLTVGKWYEVFDGDDAPIMVYSGSYVVIADRGNYTRLSMRHFKTLEELRNEKLSELGI